LYNAIGIAIEEKYKICAGGEHRGYSDRAQSAKAQHQKCIELKYSKFNTTHTNA